jgi:ElaB/YqjD/DUF883 family membrane-anchored ribosome-binding protein
MDQIAEDRTLHLKHAVEGRLRDVNREVSRLDRRVKQFVRQKPLAAAFAALAVGFVLGRLVSRR